MSLRKLEYYKSLALANWRNEVHAHYAQLRHAYPGPFDNIPPRDELKRARAILALTEETDTPSSKIQQTVAERHGSLGQRILIFTRSRVA